MPSPSDRTVAVEVVPDKNTARRRARRVHRGHDQVGARALGQPG